jgi:hypothetical protein
MKKVENLANLNNNVKFYYMYNTEQNLKFLSQKYPTVFENLKSYPQLLIIKDNQIQIFSEKLFLKYSSTDNMINEELKKNIQKI